MGREEVFVHELLSHKYVIHLPRHSLQQPNATKFACPPADPPTYKIFLSIQNYISALVLTPSVKNYLIILRKTFSSDKLTLFLGRYNANKRQENVKHKHLYL